MLVRFKNSICTRQACLAFSLLALCKPICRRLWKKQRRWKHRATTQENGRCPILVPKGQDMQTSSRSSMGLDAFALPLVVCLWWFRWRILSWLALLWSKKVRDIRKKTRVRWCERRVVFTSTLYTPSPVLESCCSVHPLRFEWFRYNSFGSSALWSMATVSQGHLGCKL